MSVDDLYAVVLDTRTGEPIPCVFCNSAPQIVIYDGCCSLTCTQALDDLVEAEYYGADLTAAA